VNVAPQTVTVGRVPETLRWGVCFALALCFHGVVVGALLAHWSENSDLVANAPIITIDLAPVAVAPDTTPNELPPGPQQAEAEPASEPDPVKPVEKLELPPEPKAELPMAVTPAPVPPLKPREEKPKQQHASLPSAPSTAENTAERAAAPAPGASSRNPYAVPNWKSRLVAALERSKRYPTEARAHGEQGVAQLAFSIDRHGGVHNARIAHSSGSELLDSETLALLQRAQPLPPPPPELAGSEIVIVVPIRYNIR
jgi:periplasmic protein TonB